ncbi:MAG: nickel-responsive transcriptional regulator NikR [Kiritimatiellae bacterium]|nr:nickel-responsive transcriptional regulator NikR [Kiritimatiellia bacterium]
MSTLTRFSVSLKKTLLDRFDRQIRREGYPTRSKAVADLVRNSLVVREWEAGREVAGAVLLVYDHHKRELSSRLVHVQHDYHDLIISSQHIHLDHDNCLEIIAVRGKPGEVQALVRKLKSIKGVKFTRLATASTGRAL